MCCYRLPRALKEFELSSTFVLVWRQNLECFLNDSHALSTSLNSRPFSFFSPQTLMHSHRLPRALKEYELSFSFGLKLSCAVIDSHVLSKNLNSRPLSFLFGVKLTCTLNDCHLFSMSLHVPLSRTASIENGTPSYTYARRLLLNFSLD